jgi:hypothetical protein
MKIHVYCVLELDSKAEIPEDEQNRIKVAIMRESKAVLDSMLAGVWVLNEKLAGEDYDYKVLVSG